MGNRGITKQLLIEEIRDGERKAERLFEKGYAYITKITPADSIERMACSYGSQISQTLSAIRGMLEEGILQLVEREDNHE